MKKLLFLLTLALSFAVGCQTDTTVDVASGEEGVVLNVSLAQTRVTLGGKVGEEYPAYWSEGDKLVVNGVQSQAAVIDANDKSKATFKFSESSLAYPFNITYPYCATTTAEQPMVEFSAEQNYAEGSFEAGSAPMCGYTAKEGDDVTLNHLSTILHFPIVSRFEGAVLDKVVITSKNKIAGAFAVNCQNATISATEGCTNVVTYSLPDNFTLSTTTPSDLFIVLPAVEVGSCKIEFIEASGEKMTAAWSPNATLSKGVVVEFKTIAYQPKLAITLPSMYGESDELIFFSKKYADDDEIKIMSFNIRTSLTEADSANNWDNRKEACVELIKDQRPGIIGFQEAKYAYHWTYMKEQLAYAYDGYGVNRDTGAESGTGEVMGIMYDRNIIEKIDGGTFWLSETPDVPSKGFGANYSRNATWGIFKHIPTGKIFYYINTHLDHQVAEAQVEGMKLISQHFEQYKEKYPLFLTGDLNITSSNVALDVIESYMYNARDAAPASLTDYNTTYNGYKTDKMSIIDHIYCSDYLRVVKYHTIHEKYGDVTFVSDHYPIFAIIEL
jgi:endonuclease/exonuclease/phosphatase family metal-dependent hydrolase